MENRTYYGLMQNKDRHTHLEQMDLPTKSTNVVGDIEMLGLLADRPSFQLTIKWERNRILEQILEIDYPFYKLNNELRILLKNWRLQEATNATDQTKFPNGTVEEIMHQLLEDKTTLAENVIIPFDIKSFQEQVRKTMEL